jgi:hypothetical protein
MPTTDAMLAFEMLRILLWTTWLCPVRSEETTALEHQKICQGSTNIANKNIF